MGSTHIHTVPTDTVLLTWFLLPVDRVQYYQSRLVAVAEVANAIVDPSFALMPDDELVRSVCPQCLSSVKGELHVNFGQLTQETGTTKNITIRMSWGLHHSWEKICGGGGLTWLYSTNTSMTIYCTSHVTDLALIGSLASRPDCPHMLLLHNYCDCAIVVNTHGERGLTRLTEYASHTCYNTTCTSEWEMNARKLRSSCTSMLATTTILLVLGQK